MQEAVIFVGFLSLEELCYLLGKGGYVFGSIGLFVCLSVCLWTTILKTLCSGNVDLNLLLHGGQTLDYCQNKPL